MKKFVFFILVTCFSSFLFAQEDDNYVFGDTDRNPAPRINNSGFDWSKVTVGGGLGLTFGTITYIEIAPILGYYLTDNILAGVGVNYIYYENANFNYKTSIYGGRVFGQYLFNDLPLLAHVETELINIDLFGNNERVNITNVYVGGGFKQRLGGASYLFVLGLWNLNETRESFFIQPNPTIRIGVSIGL